MELIKTKFILIYKIREQKISIKTEYSAKCFSLIFYLQFTLKKPRNPKSDMSRVLLN